MSDPIPADILQRVADDFGEENAERLVAYLQTKIPESLPNGTRPRHLRCIVHLADGDENQLQHFVAACLVDTRDVMLWAEYEQDAEGELLRKRDFSQPFGEADLE